jgi:hypothetical protein
MRSQEDYIEIIIDALEHLNGDNPIADKLASYLYIPDKRLSEYLRQLKEFLEIEKPTKAQLQLRGTLLEQIVYLAFLGLKGTSSYKSYQSPSAQYDLLVSGDNQNWRVICEQLYLPFTRRDIVIEAKAKMEKLPDKDFARLCSIMDLTLTGAGLGIFFTLMGAAGFPDRKDTTRQRAIRDCRLRQAIFHAKTEKFIVVLDQEDIWGLDQNGALILTLIRKIRDLRELCGIKTTPIEEPFEIDLPPHLEKLRDT